MKQELAHLSTPAAGPRGECGPAANGSAGFLLLLPGGFGRLLRERPAGYRGGSASRAEAAAAFCLGRPVGSYRALHGRRVPFLALAGTRFLPPAFLGWLLLYLVSTLAYSLYLKRIELVDVLMLSGLYTVRLLAGSAATHSHISPWLAGFAVFLFFSLAIVKRFAELEIYA